MRWLSGMFRAEQGDVAANIGIGGVLGEEVVDARARVREQHLLDELDGRRRALDVQQHRADLRQLWPLAPSGI